MGLLKAGVGALGGVMADQWREFFYCDSLDANTLVAKGKPRVTGRSSNTMGNQNIISNGSIVAVNEGQCMMIVESGAVVEVCAEPGEFVYDSSTEPSILYGGLGEGILKSFQQIGQRFTFGGDPGKDQRVYYFNTKEIMGNKYGTAAPIPFRVVDVNIGLDVDISVRCNGEYSYRLTDPLLFYKNVCGNVDPDFTRDKLDSQLKSELLTALQPAFARISAMGVRYSAVPAHTSELAQILNDELSESWSQHRGIEIAVFGLNSIAASPEDEQMIKDLQKAAVMRDPSMMAAGLAAAQADAMRAAASNENGAVGAFMGMGMAGSMGAMGASSLVDAARGSQGVPPNQYGMAAGGGFGGSAPAPAAGSWTCSCGATNTGKFCVECGKPKPAPAGAWTCSCGASNTGKFCTECGSPRPAPAGTWTCSCGATNTGKFCTECGSPQPGA